MEMTEKARVSSEFFIQSTHSHRHSHCVHYQVTRTNLETFPHVQHAHTGQLPHNAQQSGLFLHTNARSSSDDKAYYCDQYFSRTGSVHLREQQVGLFVRMPTPNQ